MRSTMDHDMTRSDHLSITVDRYTHGAHITVSMCEHVRGIPLYGRVIPQYFAHDASHVSGCAHTLIT